MRTFARASREYISNPSDRRYKQVGEKQMPELRKKQKGSTKKASSSSDVIPSDVSRVALACRLRRAGYSYESIAEKAGYNNANTACQAVNRAMKKVIFDEAAMLKIWQLGQIEDALKVVMKRIIVDDSNSLWAVDRLAPLLKRQAELLGLDSKPNEIEASSVRRVYEFK
jgi:hypothetical protein